MGKVSGDYVARHDADDLSMPKRFESFIYFLKNNPDLNIYSTPAYLINGQDTIIKTIPNFFRRNGFNPKTLNYFNSLIHGTLIVKTNVLKESKYDENIEYCQEFDLYHRLIKKGFKIEYDQKNISYMLRKHQMQISEKNSNDQIKVFNKIMEKNNLVVHNKKKYRLIFRLWDIYFYFKSFFKK